MNYFFRNSFNCNSKQDIVNFPKRSVDWVMRFPLTDTEDRIFNRATSDISDVLGKPLLLFQIPLKQFLQSNPK